MRIKTKQSFINYLLVMIALFCVYTFISSLIGHQDWQVVDDMNQNKWLPVVGVSLPDIVAIAFDKTGTHGAAISSDGAFITTVNGGKDWRAGGQAPLEVGEMVTALSVLDGGEISIAAGVDESNSTAIYQTNINRSLKTEWTQQTGELGGIAGADVDGEIFVGSGGLVARRQGTDWAFTKLLGNANAMLYGAVQHGETILIAGDKGRVFFSNDKGHTWTDSVIDSKPAPLPFYAAAISENGPMVGGSQGNFFHQTENGWQKITGLNDGQSIFALYFDAVSKRGFAAGGTDSGSEPFIISTEDAGESWYFESISLKNKGRIVSITRGSAGWFAATLGGHILMRDSQDLN